MDLDGLIKYVKADGCRVRLYNKKYIYNGSIGTFWVSDAGPIISLAADDSKKHVLTTTLHEYGHYLQWKDGFTETLESICDAHTVHDWWINGRTELSQNEWKVARNVHLIHEWDAEVRGLEVADKLKIKPFDRDFYLQGAYSYMIAIKWSWDNQKDWIRCTPRKLCPAKELTKKQLFAPLTIKEKLLVRKIKIQ